MIVLTRPVFEFPINWRDPVNQSFNYDLKEVSLGFGASYFTSLQTSVVRGWDVTLDLRTDDAIAAYDAFVLSLSGRLAGFWFPAPVEGMRVLSIQSGSRITVSELDLGENAPGDEYYYLSYPGQTPAVISIGSLASGGGGVVIDWSASVPWLAGADPARVSVFSLHYVRLGDDTEKATFPAEGWQRRSVKVVELPSEYAAIETGTQRIFLFHLWAEVPASTDWYYTNFAADVVSQNRLFCRYEMEHGTLTRSTDLSGEEIEVTARFDDSHPFSLFLPVQFARPLWIEIFEVSFADPDTRNRSFFGRVVSVVDSGDRVKAKCQTLNWALGKKAPGPYIGPVCPWDVYNPASCKAIRAKFETAGVVTAVHTSDAPFTVTVQLNVPNAHRATADWFANGWIETGLGTGFEVRSILSSTTVDGVVTLVINAPLFHVSEGDWAQLIPGCDGSMAMCKSKFKNYLNFGGFPFVPAQNPSLTTVANTGGGKGK